MKTSIKKLNKEYDRGNNFKYQCTIEDVDGLLKSGTILKDITTIDRSNIQNETTITTTHEVEVCLYEYDNGTSDIYSYKLYERKADSGKVREEEWRLNGELHRMGNEPAIKHEKYDNDSTAEYYFTQKTSYYVEGVIIYAENSKNENLDDREKFKKLKDYIDTSLKNGVEPKKALSHHDTYKTILEDIKKYTEVTITYYSETRHASSKESAEALYERLSEVSEFKEILKDDMTIAEYSLFLEDVMKYCEHQLWDGAEQKETSFNEFVHTMDSMQEEETNYKRRNLKR